MVLNELEYFSQYLPVKMLSAFCLFPASLGVGFTWQVGQVLGGEADTSYFIFLSYLKAISVGKRP